MPRESNPGLFGSRSRPGLAGMGMGLFGSQARPGMRGSSLGSLSGSSLGDAAQTMAPPEPPSGTMPPTVPIPTVGGSSTMLYLGLGAAALGAWWFLIRKK